MNVNTNDAPTVSVIVPVRDREGLLRSLVDALDDQTYRDFELIIVDDGSTDDSARVADHRVVGARLARVLHSNGQGAVVGRQRGVEASSAPIVAFTDSDCVPDPAWLAAGVTAIEEGADLVNGPTQPAHPLKPLQRSIWSGTEGLYPTCNMFYRRAAFERVGGFDEGTAERLGFRPNRRARGLGFGEDSLLAWRVQRSGGVAKHVPEALVFHHVFPPDVRDTLSRTWQMAAFPRLVREIPELRPTMVHSGILFGNRNRLPLYVAALALALHRPKVALGAVGWWALLRYGDLYRSTDARWYERLKALPFEMAVDVVVGIALLAGSVRARTPLL